MNVPKIMLYWSIPLIFFGALLDVIFIESHSFKTYLRICTWEFMIFWTGIYTGYWFKRKELVGVNE